MYSLYGSFRICFNSSLSCVCVCVNQRITPWNPFLPFTLHGIWGSHVSSQVYVACAFYLKSLLMGSYVKFLRLLCPWATLLMPSFRYKLSCSSLPFRGRNTVKSNSTTVYEYGVKQALGEQSTGNWTYDNSGILGLATGAKAGWSDLARSAPA